MRVPRSWGTLFGDVFQGAIEGAVAGAGLGCAVSLPVGCGPGAIAGAISGVVGGVIGGLINGVTGQYDYITPSYVLGSELQVLNIIFADTYDYIGGYVSACSRGVDCTEGIALQCTALYLTFHATLAEILMGGVLEQADSQLAGILGYVGNANTELSAYRSCK